MLVTLGVITATMSASQKSSHIDSNVALDWVQYATGVALLTIALLLSGFLGLIQDWAYIRYRHSHITPSREPNAEQKHNEGLPPLWQESMFYLHFLGLPLFVFVCKDIIIQFRAIHSGPKTSFRLPSPETFRKFTVSIPEAYIPLLLNTFTQLLCISGVHRLTTKVSSLTVTLVLAVRKAVSLFISAVWFERSGWSGMMWIGAALVLVGTIGYSIGSGRTNEQLKKE